MHIRLETSAIGITNFTKYFASSRQENEQECVREARKELANKGDTTGEKLDRYIDWTLLSLNCCSSDKRNNARERKKNNFCSVVFMSLLSICVAIQILSIYYIPIDVSFFLHLFVVVGEQKM